MQESGGEAPSAEAPSQQSHGAPAAAAGGGKAGAAARSKKSGVAVRPLRG
eukprot:COSAG01_NODE_3982_length_5467_cov_3.487891_12_plen_50_part_00